MNIFINASNLNGGGGAQVADSFCRYLNDFPQHSFLVVLSSALNKTFKAIENYKNVEALSYDYPLKDYRSLITQRNTFLDGLVKEKSIDVVLTIFGPMKWKPRCCHLCGFALPHLVIPESPFFENLSFFESLKYRIHRKIDSYLFGRSTKFFYTENPMISERVGKLIKGSKVFTITNYYNQVFDNKEEWNYFKLPPFEGVRLLDIASPSPHKNHRFAIDVARCLRSNYPNFRFQFVFTISEQSMCPIPDDLKDFFLFIDTVDISHCPSLYEQCDIAFQPTMLECFTATYPEAMRMCKPIATSNLEFAKGLCGNAALYFDPQNALDAAQVIYSLANDKQLESDLVEEGKKQLLKYDNSRERATKLIRACEELIYCS